MLFFELLVLHIWWKFLQTIYDLLNFFSLIPSFPRKSNHTRREFTTYKKIREVNYIVENCDFFLFMLQNFQPKHTCTVSVT